MKISRRNFVRLAIYGTPFALFAEAKFIEPTRLKVSQLRLENPSAGLRFVHFTDLHHKGDRDYLLAVVDRINSLSPDFVCFTGDLVEEEIHLEEALEILGRVRTPLFGVPGNHDYWSGIPFEPVRRVFETTGGAWLLDESREFKGKVNIVGLSCKQENQPLPPLNPTLKNILLMHYPAWADKLGGKKFDLLLAGHSHGGQVRLPFFGPLVVPFGVDGYDLGHFQTAGGPLYVGSGIGCFYLNLRFNCRPEITVVEI